MIDVLSSVLSTLIRSENERRDVLAVSLKETLVGETEACSILYLDYEGSGLCLSQSYDDKKSSWLILDKVDVNGKNTIHAYTVTSKCMQATCEQ